MRKGRVGWLSLEKVRSIFDVVSWFHGVYIKLYVCEEKVSSGFLKIKSEKTAD